MKELRSQRKYGEATERLATAKIRATTTPSGEGQREIGLLLEPSLGTPSRRRNYISPCKERWGHKADRDTAGHAAEVERVMERPRFRPSHHHPVPQQYLPLAKANQKPVDTRAWEMQSSGSDKTVKVKGCERSGGNQAQHWLTSCLETWQCPCPKAFSIKRSSLLRKTRSCTLLWLLLVSLGEPFTKFTIAHTQLSTPSWLSFQNMPNSLSAKPLHVLLPKTKIHSPPLSSLSHTHLLLHQQFCLSALASSWEASQSLPPHTFPGLLGALSLFPWHSVLTSGIVLSPGYCKCQFADLPH